MINKLKVEIIQEHFIPSFDKQSYIIRAMPLVDEKSEYTIRLGTLYLFDQFCEEQINSKGKLKPFNMQLPLIFRISWNDNYHDEYVLKRIKSNRSKKQGEISFFIRGSLRILRRKSEETKKSTLAFSVKKRKKQSVNTYGEPIDLNRLFNTIEFFDKGIAKFPTPILYTGWTQ